MRRAIPTVWVLMFVFGLGISVLSLPQNVSGQTDKEKKERKQEREDDDNDKDERLTAKDRKKAKITLEQAREIALKRVPGTVVEEELEKEKGRLQYAFDIRDSGGKIWDVEIDAITGEVLQAVEDDEDTETNGTGLNRAKTSVYRVASAVRRSTVGIVEKLF